MAKTPQKVLRGWLLETLLDLGGSATRKVALARMGKLFRERFTDEDWEAPRTHPNEAAWENRASYERNKMRAEGLLVSGKHGIWELTAAGRAEALRVTGRRR